MGIFDLFKRNTKSAAPRSPDPTPVNPSPPAKTKLLSSSELSEHIKSAIPSAAGLYPHEILMLNYASHYNHLKNDFPGFWKRDYYVDDPQQLLDSLLDRGFLCYSDISASLEKRPMSVLKELLEKNNEKSPSKKADVIARIQELFDSKQLEELFPERYYRLTEKGMIEVEQNEYVLYLHQHRFMTVWEMNSLLKKTSVNANRYRDIIWGELHHHSIEHMKNGDFGIYCNDKLAMHEFVLEENKYKEALPLLCEVISYDLSGLGNGEFNLISNSDASTRLVRYNSRITNLICNQSSSEVTLPSRIIERFAALYKALEVSADEFIKTCYQIFSRIQIHERVFTAEECANIALSEIGLEQRKLKNSYQIAQQRLKAMLHL